VALQQVLLLLVVLAVVRVSMEGGPLGRVLRDCIGDEVPKETAAAAACYLGRFHQGPAAAGVPKGAVRLPL
jgi:hypothetical protein